MSGRYIKQEPYVDEHGIYMPLKEYVPEGTCSTYQCVMTKKMFVDAYNKWIAHNPFCRSYNDDDADCWCE